MTYKNALRVGVWTALVISLLTLTEWHVLWPVAAALALGAAGLEVHKG